MTTIHAPKVHVGMATCKGSIVRAEINEAPMCVSISTEDVSVQVAVPIPDWSREQASRSSRYQIPSRNVAQSFSHTPVLDVAPHRKDNSNVQPT